MAEAQKTSEPTPAAGAPAAPVTPPVPPRRSPGHRGADVKDTVAEMAAKAHEISLEAGSKMAAAMKDVINAAAGLSGFVIESARDLVQYMVRRGQMTQEEADKLIREVESAMPKRKPAAVVHPPARSSTAPAARSAPTAYRPATVTHQPSHVPARAASKPAPKKAAAKPKTAAKKPAAKKPVPKKPAAKKAASKAASRASAKRKPAAKKPAAKKAKRR